MNKSKKSKARCGKHCGECCQCSPCVNMRALWTVVGNLQGVEVALSGKKPDVQWARDLVAQMDIGAAHAAHDHYCELVMSHSLT